jgi:hypothetical protein
MMSPQKFPPGWDEARVRQVLEHYENQTEGERFAEIEAERNKVIAVPNELVLEVQALTDGKTESP